MGAITVSARVLGRRRPLVPDWSVPWPPEPQRGDGEGLTLRELITRIVAKEVADFQGRQVGRRFLTGLTEQQIDAVAVDVQQRPAGEAGAEESPAPPRWSGHAVLLLDLVDWLRFAAG